MQAISGLTTKIHRHSGVWASRSVEIIAPFGKSDPLDSGFAYLKDHHKIITDHQIIIKVFTEFSSDEIRLKSFMNHQVLDSKVSLL